MRIAAYCRVSTGSEEQLESLANQKTFFEDFAQKHNYELVNIYADEGISGKQMSNRAQFLKMLDDAQYNIFDMVVVKDISRFSRNTVDFLTAIRQLKSQNIETTFLSNNQTVLGNSEFTLTLFSALAQEESANLSKRVKFGKKINAEKGRVPNMIFGYDKVDTFNLVINPQEAEVVKKIFDMYLYGYGSRLISLKLVELNILTKKGASMWTPKTVRRILTNPVYSGVLVNNKSESKDYLTGSKLQHTPDQYFYHERPEYQIVSKEDFEKTKQQILQRQEMYKNKNPAGRFSNKHVFSNLIQCEHCGYSYGRIKQTYKNTFIRWRCTGNNLYTSKFCSNTFKVDEDKLITIILDYFKSFISDKDKFFNELNNLKEKNVNINSVETEIIREQLAKIDKLKEKFKSMYTNDIIGIEELKAKNSELLAQQQALESKFTVAKREIDESKKIENIAAEKLVKIQEAVDSNTLDNASLKEIIEKITINHDGEVHIYLKP